MSKQFHSKHKLLKSYKTDIWGKYILKQNKTLIFNKKVGTSIHENILYTQKMLPIKITNKLKQNNIKLKKISSTWNLLYLYNYSFYLKKNKQYLLQFNDTHTNLNKKNKTTYGILLLNRQRLRKFYGNIKLKQFKKILKKSKKLNPNSKLNSFVYLLETRLDIILYRLNITTSIFHARQLILHNHILVNKNIINFPNYNIQFNDIITIKHTLKYKIIKNLYKLLDTKTFIPLPNYIEINYKTLEFIFLKKINYNEVFYPSFQQQNLRNNLIHILNFI